MKAQRGLFPSNLNDGSQLSAIWLFLFVTWVGGNGKKISFVFLWIWGHISCWATPSSVFRYHLNGCWEGQIKPKSQRYTLSLLCSFCSPDLILFSGILGRIWRHFWLSQLKERGYRALHNVWAEALISERIVHFLQGTRRYARWES